MLPMELVSTESPPSPASESPSLRSTGRLNPRQLAPHRRNAQKSTEPLTQAGEYRSALNAENRRLLPEAVVRDLRARGEDPQDFLRLDRDLAAIFHPYDPHISKAAAKLASAIGHGANPSEPDRLKGIRMSGVDQNRQAANPTQLSRFFSVDYAERRACFWKITVSGCVSSQIKGLRPGERPKKKSEAERTRQG